MRARFLDLTVDQLAAALPDVMDEETCLVVMGDGVHRLDVAEEWFMSPREMAQQILENLGSADNIKGEAS